MVHYASPGRDCLKDDDHTDQCVPGPWYGSQPSMDPDWSHEHHLTGALGTCAQCGRTWPKRCHESRRRYCGTVCAKAARRNQDRVRLRERYRWQKPIRAHNKGVEAAYQERFQQQLSQPDLPWSEEVLAEFEEWLEWSEEEWIES
jgi:hypothetical protein